MQKTFTIVQTVDTDIAQALMSQIGNDTYHVSDRTERLSHCKSGSVHSAYLVDTNHPNGMEVHVILDSADIHIYNVRTAAKITVPIARPGQISRYGISDVNLMDKARKNQQTGRNLL